MRTLTRCLAFAVASSVVGVAQADEPWSDQDSAWPPQRYELGDFGITPAAEYRANWLYVNPISLNTITERRATWIEHRLRLDLSVDYDEKVRITTSIDGLDGVLWGDNGDFGGDPSSDRGATVATRDPNVTQPCIQYRGEGDALDAEYYGYALCEGEHLRIRRLYGDVVTPIGLIRVGRQPVTLGNNILGVTGDGRHNRFGFARQGNSVDRIVFGTKPLEAFKPEAARDLSQDRGLIVSVGYDHLVTDAPRLFRDDLHGVLGALVYRQPEHPLGTELDLLGFYAHRWNELYNTNVNTLGARAINRFPGNILVGLEVAANLGTTEEVSAAYSQISNDPVVEQTIRQIGARAVGRYDHDYFSAYLEIDYASGDGDPDNRSDLTQFVWAPDMNVGLLMFEHVNHFQSARASAAAVEALRRLEAPSFPAETINTRGSFTSAFALFPQFDFKPHKDVLLRTGVLMAWSPEPVVDPVGSLLARDGRELEDDLVNFAGGKPGQYYGTEIDLRGQWKFVDHFAFDLEGAVLFPGDALEDENGDAVRSVLVQGRTTFFF